MRATERLALCSRSLITWAASWKVLHSSRRASRRSRSSKRISSSSRSTSSRPGSRRRAFNSTSVAAISRNSVATSRSTCSMFSTSTQNTSTMCASEISQRSTSSFRIRCRRRSNGPSNTGVETAYGTGADYPPRITALWYSAATRRYVSEIARGRPVTSPPMARVFSGIQPTGDMHSGQLPRCRAPLGRLPAPRRVGRGERPPRDLLRRRPPRDDPALGPGGAQHRDPPARARCSPRPGSAATGRSCSCRATCAPTPSSPGC